MPLQVGEFVHNRYQISQGIGNSGRHMFYLGFDHAYQVEVTVRETQITSPEERRIWLQKVVQQSYLRHPNLMQITDHFEQGETALLSVSNLASSQPILDRGQNPKPFAIHTAAAAVLAICDAVDTLHRGQPPLVHGGINHETVRNSVIGQFILVFPDWVVSQPEITAQTLQPENPTIQQDVDSLSLLLLTLITGRPTSQYLGEMTEETLRELLALSAEPVPESITDVLRKGLLSDPLQRYKKVEDFKNAVLTGLISISETQSYSSRPTPSRSQAINIDFQDASTSLPARQPEVRPSAEIVQPSTPPIRRRVPWGLL